MPNFCRLSIMPIHKIDIRIMPNKPLKSKTISESEFHCISRENTHQSTVVETRRPQNWAESQKPARICITGKFTDLTDACNSLTTC